MPTPLPHPVRGPLHFPFPFFRIMLVLVLLNLSSVFPLLISETPTLHDQMIPDAIFFVAIFFFSFPAPLG